MEKEGKMKQELKVLVLNSKFLNLSIEDLKSNTNAPVEWHVEDSSNKENIRKLLPNFNILVSTSMDISWKNEAKNLKAIFMPGAGWDKIASEAVPDGCVVTNSYEHENGIAEYVLMSMIALDRELINSHNNFKENKWFANEALPLKTSGHIAKIAKDRIYVVGGEKQEPGNRNQAPGIRN